MIWGGADAIITDIKVPNKCDVLESSRGHLPLPTHSLWKKLSSMELAPDAKKVGDHCIGIAGQQALYFPSLGIEEGTRSRWERPSWLNGQRILCLKQVLEWHPTMCGRRRAGQAASFAPEGRGRLSYRWNWHQVDSSVTRETSRGTHPSLPLC